MLQRVAVCCSVLRHVAVFGSVCSMLQCSVLQGVAVCCRVLQCVAGCCSVLQGVAVFDGVQGLESMVQGLGFREGLG